VTLKQLYNKKIKLAPKEPGCYVWKNKDDKVLYIGKAVNIRSRVSSYVNNYDRLDPKIRAMIDQVADVEFLTVDSEVEAIILETNLIKKYKPKYNRLMKDDKNYSWVRIDWYNDYPTVKIVRENRDVKKGKEKDKAEYYGPYPARFPVVKVLRRLRKVFPYCDHLPKARGKDVALQRLSKPCFNYHIGLCSGICIGKISKTEHRKNIKGVRDFFKGKKNKILEDAKREMLKLSKQKKYEQASVLRDRVSDLEYVTQHIKVDKEVDDIVLEHIKRSAREKGLEELITRIQGTPPSSSSTSSEVLDSSPPNLGGERLERSESLEGVYTSTLRF
jgi:excinuclease ABC subunit C